jgi:two-component system, sporulation sensor kinase E
MTTETQGTSVLESGRLQRFALDAAGVGTWWLDGASRGWAWDAHCRDICGVAEGKSEFAADFLNCFHVEDRESVSNAIEKVLQLSGPTFFQLQCRVMRPDRELRWVTVKGEAVGDAPTRQCIGILVDATEMKRAQQALIESEKFAAAGRLAASIAHEINNPLEALTNFLYLMRITHDDKLREDYLAMSESELARVSTIVTSTLGFYRDPLGVVSCDLSKLIKSVLQLFQGRMALANVTLKLELRGELYVRCEQGEMRQVVVNLVSNALDAMPNGGCLAVRCRRAGKKPEDGLRLTVSDSGSGMQLDVVKHIFEAFFTTKGATGTGLGLWLSAEILRRQGFGIRVRSTLHRGTTFSLRLANRRAAR